MLFFCTGHTGTQHFSTTKAWLHDLVWPMKCSQKCCVLHLTFDSLPALPLQHVYLRRCHKIKQPGTKSQCLKSSYCEELPEPSPNFVTLCEWDINFCCVKPLVGVVCYHSVVYHAWYNLYSFKPFIIGRLLRVAENILIHTIYSNLTWKQFSCKRRHLPSWQNKYLLFLPAKMPISF